MTRKQFEAFVLNRFRGNEDIRVERQMSTDTHDKDRCIALSKANTRTNTAQIEPIGTQTKDITLSFMYSKEGNIMAQICVDGWNRGISVKWYDGNEEQKINVLLDVFHHHNEIEELYKKYSDAITGILEKNGKTNEYHMYCTIFKETQEFDGYYGLVAMLYLFNNPLIEEKVFTLVCAETEKGNGVVIHYSESVLTISRKEKQIAEYPLHPNVAIR